MNTNSPYFYRQNKPTWSSVFNSVDRQIESLFAGLPSLLDFGTPGRVAQGAPLSGVRWYENDTAYLARLDLPGVEPGAIQLTLEEGRLQLEAARTVATGAKAGEEASARQSYRFSIAVPEGVDAEQVSARSDKGVLSITLPKVAKAQPRRIEIAAPVA